MAFLDFSRQERIPNDTRVGMLQNLNIT
jgi:hypothetical protein